MPAPDATITLNVRLFLGSIAVAAFALGVNQAGWRHKFLIVSLFSISGISALGAIFYPNLSVSWPNFTASLSQVASNAWVWFGLVIFLALYVLIWPIRVNPKAHKHSETQARFTREISVLPTPDLSPRPLERWEQLMNACLGRTEIETNHISKEHAGELLEITGFVYDVGSYVDSTAVISIEPEPTKRGLIHARVNDKDRAIRASALRKGDRIAAHGQVLVISVNSVTLTDCDFTRL